MDVDENVPKLCLRIPQFFNSLYSLAVVGALLLLVPPVPLYHSSTPEIIFLCHAIGSSSSMQDGLIGGILEHDKLIYGHVSLEEVFGFYVIEGGALSYTLDLLCLTVTIAQ